MILPYLLKQSFKNIWYNGLNVVLLLLLLLTWLKNLIPNISTKMVAKSAGAVEYTDCISAEG